MTHVTHVTTLAHDDPHHLFLVGVRTAILLRKVSPDSGGLTRIPRVGTPGCVALLASRAVECGRFGPFFQWEPKN